MADQTFTYHGPTSGVTLLQEDGTTREVMLFDGYSVPLPAEHPHVAALIAQQFLTPAKPQEVPPRRSSTRKPAEEIS